MFGLGLGESTNPNAFEAGVEMVTLAQRSLGQYERPSWALCFCGGQHDPVAVLEGIRRELPNITVVGGSAIGLITRQQIGSTGYECALALFGESFAPVDIIVIDRLDRDERQAGIRLGKRLRDIVNIDLTVLLFYDSVKSAPPPVLHIGSRLMHGLYAGLDGVHPAIVGAGTMSDLEMTESYVLAGDGPLKHAAVAVVMPTRVSTHTTIMHGCQPVSRYFTITRIEGAKVFELDGRPATEVLSERLGLQPHELSSQQNSMTLTLGEKHGDPFEPFDESKYVNRMVISVDPAEGSVMLFEADFEVSSRVQLMVADLDTMLHSAERQTQKLLALIEDQEPLFGLYIDCAGRSPAFSGADVSEAHIVQRNIGARCPLLGFYSGVEIAPLLGQSRPLDWTGVLTLFTRR